MFDLKRFSLHDKVAIVTGGGRGIGKGIALGFANAGAKIVVTSRKINNIEATAEEIRSFGGQAMPLQSHLGKIEQIQKMVDAVMAEYGKIDILVNNAGASPALASVLESDEHLWDTIMNLNMKGMYFTSQAVARIMKKQGWGKIINVASVDAHKVEPMVSIYSISKAGVRQITNAFAQELAPFNIQVNTLSPGPFSTKMMDSHYFHLPPEQQKVMMDNFVKSLPMGKIGNPDDIAGAAILLASDASNYITGAEIIVDGGILLGGINPLAL